VRGWYHKRLYGQQKLKYVCMRLWWWWWWGGGGVRTGSCGIGEAEGSHLPVLLRCMRVMNILKLVFNASQPSANHVMSDMHRLNFGLRFF
jgi:hypothetical protein